ncbi:YciI family protein [Actinoallomurus spadix]|uniref:YciI family protein n=1 Tax=Actinoallomurus spadix TaxID=79912 RepID=A0ABN0WXC2_9ACTN|nr:YciI family protein [Actinoallomurus spadix]MCO5991597.1 YciI family protein [Actinoallomurus spadix]
MKYLLLVNTSSPDSAEELPAEGPTVEEFVVFEKAIAEAGVKLDGNALDLSNATTVHVRGSGERVVTDGPFAETREIVGGYYLIDVPDLDAALDWAARCPGARYGTVEVRTIEEHGQP